MLLNDDDKQLSEVSSSLSGYKSYFLEVNILLLEIYSICGSSLLSSQCAYRRLKPAHTHNAEYTTAHTQQSDIGRIGTMCSVWITIPQKDFKLVFPAK